MAFSQYPYNTAEENSMGSSRKYPYSPHRRDWNFLGGGGSVRPKNLKKCMKPNWNFQTGGGGGGLRKNPFRGGDMDIFWNYTMHKFPKLMSSGVKYSHLQERVTSESSDQIASKSCLISMW